ncbi:hypothetical protein BDZ94DRAFT_1195247 [Collybia nuda]|uniref:Receptor expression-enhancing protein n=1 Tax=Collybia nuda TaxID=64659 RepID=A0A9P6CDP3_9AGAR|nr:hypothetical protein BDZ94DRAFT_1195247 [Collybia nuda]
MPLVVPILRLAMLFLNVYDSYKTLKFPPPSARNGGQPSQRAISQRKRDMKGCLAVWIVWSCVITYERLAEAIISIFIPFYDEFKSLALLFLIMTRARGAEPIFLHIIRPLLKPYTATLDICLDFVCMIGDIIFALVTLPLQPVLSWWQKSVSLYGGALDSEVESPVVESNPTALRIPPRTAEAQANSNALRIPRKVSSDQQPNGRQGGVQLGRQPQGNSVHYPRVIPDGLPNGTSSHEIWNPPASSYTEEDFPDDPNATIKSRKRPNVRDIFDLPRGTEETAREREEVEEWRQYPAFPSAYPPTPLVVSSSRLPDNTATPNAPVLSDISEDPPQEDFRESLLPPRKPLNPGFADGLSDEKFSFGVQNNNNLFDDIVVDVDSGTDDEGEDAFNITLQTPLPPSPLSRSHLRAVALQDRQASLTSSVGSRSTTLTTADNKSSLRTRSSIDSLSSASISMSELSPSVLGKKRPLPPMIEDHVKTRVLLMEEKALENNLHKKVPTKTATRKPRPLVPRNGPRRVQPLSPKAKILEGMSSSSDDAEDDSTSDPISPHIKRRKVLTPPRVVNARRSARTRVARDTIKAKSREVPSAPSRTSSRLHPASPTPMLSPPLTAHSSQSDFSSTNDRPLRPGGKELGKKK